MTVPAIETHRRVLEPAEFLEEVFPSIPGATSEVMAGLYKVRMNFAKDVHVDTMTSGEMERFLLRQRSCSKLKD